MMKENNTTSKRTWIVPPGLIASVKSFENLYKLRQAIPLMIIGPSGVGKSLFVHIYEHLYKCEHGDAKPFKRLNCSTFSKELITSELFGHVKGAFTGALNDKKGLIEVADGGCVVLEEIGELSKENQATLLTFIEDGYFYPVGSTEDKHSTVHIISTTNKSKDNFREDFLHRFFPFYVPPLYERRQDILYYLTHVFPELAEMLVPWEVLTLLCYNWPGNVREIERLCQLIAWEKENKKNWPTQEDLPFAENVFFKYLEGEGRYTGIKIEKIISLFTDLKKFGIDTSFLEKFLNEFGLGLILPRKNLKHSIKPVFHNRDLKYKRDEATNNRLEVETSYGTKAFDQAFQGLMIFCSLFFQEINANKNLLDIKKDKESTIPAVAATKLIQKPNSNHFKLEKEIFEYLLGMRLPNNIKQLPDFYSKEFQDLMTSATNIDKIDNFINTEKLLSTLSKEELDKLHVKAVLKRTGGNVRQAAKIMDIAWSTLNESLKKYKLGKFSEI